MLYNSIAEYDQAIAETQAAISRCIGAGQSRTVGSGNANRSTNEVELTALRTHLELLQRERQMLQAGGPSVGGGANFGGFAVGAGW